MYSRPETATDVISGTAVQYFGTDVCVKFGDSRLNLPDASFSVVFRTSITSDRKKVVTLCPV